MIIYRKSLKNLFMEEKEYLLERCLICYAFKKFYSDREPNYSEFAKLIFSDRSDPVTTFRNIRQGKPKPQRINIEEASRMARAINLDLASLCFHVQKEVESGWTLDSDFSPEGSLSGPRKKKKSSSTEKKASPPPAIFPNSEDYQDGQGVL